MKSIQMTKENNGITLIALIVIIVIIFILGGVTINFINGNNGILSKTKLARDAYQNSVNDENNILSYYKKMINDASENAGNNKKLMLNRFHFNHQILVGKLQM